MITKKNNDHAKNDHKNNDHKRSQIITKSPNPLHSLHGIRPAMPRRIANNASFYFELSVGANWFSARRGEDDCL